MSEVKATVVWQGMTVDSYTDMKTGEMELYVPGGFPGTNLLATSTPSNGSTEWVVNNENLFRNSYNNSQRNNNKPVLTQEEFNKTFDTQGTTAFNNVRSDVLSNDDNYDAVQIPSEDVGSLKQGHFSNNIPGVQDPVTGVVVNSDGTVPSDPTQSGVLGQEPPTGETTVLAPGQAAPSDDSSSTPVQSGADATAETSGGDDENPIFTTPGSTEILRYPEGEPPAGIKYDYISIQAFEYKPPGIQVQGSYNESERTGKPFETIILPMQPSITESNGVSYGQDSANYLQLIAGKAAIGAIEGLSTVSFETVKKAASGLMEGAINVLQDGATKQYVAAYFAGQAVGANLIGRQTGNIVNPNLELLFNGPGLRTFNFSFPLTPRSDTETKTIRKIIRAFKRNMAPQRSSSSAFLKSPRVFKLKYIFKDNTENDTSHPFLNKFKLCMLSRFDVNYTPDNSYMTFDDGGMTRYNIDMTFQEIVPNYADEYPLNENNMGF